MYCWTKRKGPSIFWLDPIIFWELYPLSILRKTFPDKKFLKQQDTKKYFLCLMKPLFQTQSQNKQAQMCSDPPKRNRYDRWNHRQTNRSTVRLAWTQMWPLFYNHAWWNHPKILIGQSNGLHTLWSLIGQSVPTCILPALWLVNLNGPIHNHGEIQW